MLMFIFLFLSIKYDFLNFNNHYNYLCLIMNFVIFLSYLLTIGLKSLDSPTFYIIEYLKNHNVTKRNEILNDLMNKDLLNIRFKKLIDEKLIINNNNYIELTNSGKFFCNILNFVMKFLKINNEG